ncbi:MAG: hypothetical protein PHE17_09130 [Thiothrix sp.]|uniref:hypothetical protein n=1 Tax=Thiothrix sp. TaxID=1032 RepID=UPI002622AB7C|nr:hypothetical protein [Thiothrix sp.]MDD5393167.1 hypothetical protein [Thiothrix sp.]
MLRMHENLGSYTYGELRADLEKYDQPIGALNMMIAANALSLEVSLVTNNIKEKDFFRGIGKYHDELKTLMTDNFKAIKI